MAPASRTAPRRRKIFPHLENESKSEEASGSGADGGNNDGDDDAANDESKSENDADYDNAKSRRSKKQAASRPSSSSSSNGDAAATGNGDGDNGASNDDAATPPASATAARNDDVAVTLHHHLLPLPLVLTVLACSGLFWIASFRDVMATGKPILDTLGVLWGQDDADANLLQYTRSTTWFDDSRGWKSKQGGLSTILSVTTDANDMGGLFVRKVGGVAGMAFHASKIWPVVFHSPPVYEAKGKNRGRWVGASWSAGHFDPVLALGMVGDVCVSMFYLGRLEEMKDAGAGGLCMAYVLTSLIEAFVMGLYMLSRRMNRRATTTNGAGSASAARAGAAGYDPEEDPNSLPSRIVARTVLIVSTLTSLVSLRDLLLPGTILSFLPRDDIYLEWTGAFLHSPPPDTVEADEHGLEAPLHAGDKFASQLLGLYLSLNGALKLLSAWGWSKGSRNMGLGRVENVERSGVVSSKMVWRAQALGDAMLLGILRMFTPAAKTASLDLRWHLMLVAYEAFILFLYGFW